MLEVTHVRKDFGAVQAVRDVSFTIPSGSTFGLLGPNGAGKTTTMRMIVGIYAPDKGSVAWRGLPIGDRVRRRFGYLPEERGLYGKMKVRDQIVYFGRLHGLTDPDIVPRAQRWIEKLGLQDFSDRPCGELSKGNQQKVQIACAAVHDPELLILDEPFSGLDPVNAEVLLATLHELKQRGATLVLSSHQMWQLEHLCDAFCIITAGENRAAGTLAHLRAAWPTRTIRVEPSTQRVCEVFARMTGARPLQPEGGALYYEVPANTQLSVLLRETRRRRSDHAVRIDRTFVARHLHPYDRRRPRGSERRSFARKRMNQFITVYSAEVLRRLRSRAFIVGLIVGAVGITIMLRLPSFIDAFASQSYRVVLAGDPALVRASKPLLRNDFNIAATLPGVTRPTPADMESHRGASSVIVLARGARGIRVRVYAKDPGSVSTAQLQRDLLPLHIGSSTNLSAAQVATLLRIPIDVLPLESKFGTAAQADQARVVANILIFLLYLLIVLNSQLIMTSVAEEKTSRIAELLVASVNPSSLLAGKIAASASLALLQMAVWVAIGFALGVHGSPGASAPPGRASVQGLSFGGISPANVAGFLVFFALGYLQMATMFAAIGSLINRTEDIGSIGGPFFIPVIAALLIAVTALQVPDAPFVVVTSFIPLVAPFVMFARIVVSSVPLWQIGLSFFINVAAIWFIAVLGGRIYRIGMLLYGRPPKLAQLWHALRA